MIDWLKSMVLLFRIFAMIREIVLEIEAYFARKRREELISFVEELLSAGAFDRPFIPPPKVM